MPRCLVTGHKGYIGSKLFLELKSLGHEVMGIDLQEDIPKDILRYLKEDNDGGFHPYYKNFKPEFVFHLACHPRVGYSIEKPVETMENNVLTTSMVLNFAKKVGAKRFIYSSSSSIYGDGDGPKSPYALQKMTSEIECRLYSELYGIDTVSLRYFNVYSPCQKDFGAYATAIANWMEHIRQNKNPFITGTGKQRRDMLNLEDAVSSNIFAMNREENFCGKYYDIGTGENISLNEMKSVVEKYFPHTTFDYVEERIGDVEETRAKISPLESIGWKTAVPIREGVDECFRRLKEEVL
jgi:UDP-glucose 4-epimerase